MNTFCIISYNLALPTPPTIVQRGQNERAQRFKEAFIEMLNQYQNEVDVIAIQELMPEQYADQIVSELKALGFEYISQPVSSMVIVNGGIFIASKWPILVENQLKFDQCINTCCLASKGVTYAKINKHGTMLHVFNTHLQAEHGEKANNVRISQLRQVRNFIQEQKIPEWECVMVVGDININLHDEQQAMMLQQYLPLHMGSLSTSRFIYTLDPKENELCGLADDNLAADVNCARTYQSTRKCECCHSEWVDICFASKYHFLPSNLKHDILPIKVNPFSIMINGDSWDNVTDVSDHFPLVTHFELPVTSANRIDNAKTFNKTNPTYTALDIGIFVGIVLLLVLLIISFAIYIFKSNYFNKNHHRTSKRLNKIYT